METFDLKKHWREQIRLIKGCRITLSLDSIVLAGVTVKEITVSKGHNLFPITLITNLETITVDEEHPWKVDTIHQN